MQVASCIQFEVGSESAGDANLKDLARHVLRNINHIYESTEVEAEIICGCIGERRSCTHGDPVSLFSAPLLAPPSGEKHPVVLRSDIVPRYHVTDIVGLEPFRYRTKLANCANHTPVRGHYPNCETFLRNKVFS